MIRTALASALAAAALLVGLFAAPAASAQADPLAELCLATGIEQVDTILAGVDDDALEGPLAPLLALGVPDSEGAFVLRADVTANDVREALDCAPLPTDPPVTTDPAPTTETPAPTTETPVPTTTAPTSDDDPTTVDPISDDGSTADTDGDQVTIVPEGSADTGSA